METTATRAMEIWRRLLTAVLNNAQHPDSANVIPALFEPHLKELHQQLADCSCKRSSCAECVGARQVLSWAWEKMDEGF